MTLVLTSICGLYDRNSGIEEAMNAYLSWEIDLVHEIRRDGTIAFGIPGETDAAA